MTLTDTSVDGMRPRGREQTNPPGLGVLPPCTSTADSSSDRHLQDIVSTAGASADPGSSSSSSRPDAELRTVKDERTRTPTEDKQDDRIDTAGSGLATIDGPGTVEECRVPEHAKHHTDGTVPSTMATNTDPSPLQGRQGQTTRKR